MIERQPYHKLTALTSTASLILLGCLSLILFSSPAFAQIANPSSGDTIAKYCSSGVCHTDSSGSSASNHSTPFNFTSTTPVGQLKLSQSCIGNNCNKITQVTKLGKIGIQLSQACEIEFKNKLKTTCLPYHDMRRFDNTNQFFAGVWVDLPYEHRLSPKIKNHEIFNPNPWTVMVDPNSDFTINAKMITVVDKSFTWINPADNSSGGIIAKTHVDRWVSPDCTQATVAPDLLLINDTINYMESGCTTTHYNDVKMLNQTIIPWNFNNPYSTLKLDSYLQSIFHKHSYFSSQNRTNAGGLGPPDCIRHTCTFTDPFKKVGW